MNGRLHTRVRHLLLLASLLVPTAFAATPALVDTQWLSDNLHLPQVRVIEVSVDPDQFERGHIPGAANLNWHTDLVDPVRRDVASQADLQARLRQIGLDDQSLVVLYGDHNNWFAAWGAWLLELYGVRDVRLLDGGRVKWELEKRPLSRTASTTPPGNLTLQPARQALRAYLPDVLAAAKQQATDQLVDIRSEQEYRGEIIAPPGLNETALRAGHIPGAVNLPWSRTVNPDGTFKSVEQLRELYASVGIDGSRPIITYCRIGERSSHTWFILHRLLGYTARNYDGSWTEYGNAIGVPIDNPAGSLWQGL